MRESDSRIHVVTIVSRMNLGGPAVLLADLANGLDQEKFSHTLITGHCETNEIDYLADNPVKGNVIYISKMARSVFVLNEIRAFYEIYKVLRREKPDVVHTHMSKAGVLGRFAARLASRKVRIVHTYHGHLLYGYFNRPQITLVIWVERLLARITNNLIAITEQVRLDLMAVKIGEGLQWKVIRLGIEIERRHERIEARQALGVSDHEFLILWIGRFEEIKNPQLALATFEILNRMQNFKFVMLGGGSMLSECKEIASSKQLGIIFPGWERDIYKYLPAADLFILTSRNEGLGMVILEAATQLVPTLATNVGGVSEFISEGETGFFAESDPQDFANKIASLKTKPAELERVGTNARAYVERNFSVEKFIHNHESLYLG
jgi:glycosyltransferase involved in cell wall biosynthesis